MPAFIAPDISISLLVPCFNASQYLQKFLDHIREMDFDEVIFYNDGSTDDTLALLKQAGCRYINSDTNKGPGFARNRLAEAAKSDYIHFHDVDDEFAPEFLGLIREKIGDRRPDVIVGYADWINSVTRESIIKWEYNEAEIANDALNYFISHPLGIINTAYKKSAFLEINGFNEQIKCWEDSDLHVKLAANNAKFSVINKVIAYSLRHNNGISANQSVCWGCRLSFLATYLDNYKNRISVANLKNEIKKVQTAFINGGAFENLSRIFFLDKEYDLSINTSRPKVLYYLNKYLIPKPVLQKLLTFYIKLQ